MSIEKLVLGNEYTKKKLATIFNESNIEFVSSGISYQEAGIFLWPNLEQNFQNFRYNNVFDLERGHMNGIAKILKILIILKFKS